MSGDPKKPPLPHLCSTPAEGRDAAPSVAPAPRRNLELDESLAGKPELTLAGVFDRTATAMGGRMLRRWLHRPLRDRGTLRARYQAVATLIDAAQHTAIAEPLKAIGDLERIVARIALRSARPRDLTQLRAALAVLPRLQQLRGAAPSPLLQHLIAELAQQQDSHRADHALLTKAIVDSPPHYLRDGGVIAAGYDAELDELRLLGSNTEQFLLDLERKERERTGLSNLK